MVGGVAAAVMYGLLDPARHAIFPKCPFLMLTGGLRCPGCGSQRALHALLHLEFKEAFLYNPMVVISIPFLLLLALLLRRVLRTLRGFLAAIGLTVHAVPPFVSSRGAGRDEQCPHLLPVRALSGDVTR